MTSPTSMYMKCRFARDFASVGRVMAVFCGNGHITRNDLNDGELSMLDELEYENSSVERQLVEGLERRAQCRVFGKEHVEPVGTCEPVKQQAEVPQAEAPRAEAPRAEDLEQSPEVQYVREKKNKKRAMPDKKILREYARQKGVPDDYLADFIEQMELQSWSYVNRGGNLVPVSESNFKAVIGSFWNREKKARENGNSVKRGGTAHASDRNAPYVESGLDNIFG